VIDVCPVNVTVVFLIAVLLEVVLFHESFRADPAGEGHSREDGVGLLLVTNQIHVVLVNFAAGVTWMSLATQVGCPDVLLKGLLVGVDLPTVFTSKLSLHPFLAQEFWTNPTILVPLLEVKVQLLLGVGSEVAERALDPLNNPLKFGKMAATL